MTARERANALFDSARTNFDDVTRDDVERAILAAQSDERERCIQAVRDAGGDNEDYHVEAIERLPPEDVKP